MTTMTVAIATPLTTPVIWVPCGTCWGQRRLYEDRNGEGLVPCVCPGCLGIGERPAASG